MQCRSRAKSLLESKKVLTKNPFKKYKKALNLYKKKNFFLYSVLANLHTTTYKKQNKRLIKTEDNTKIEFYLVCKNSTYALTIFYF